MGGFNSRNFNLRREVQFISALNFSGEAAGAGAPVTAEWGSSGIKGLLTDTAGDDISHYMPIPDRWDQRELIDVRLLWATAAASVGNRTISWIYTYALSNIGDAMTLPPATVLATPITLLQAVSGSATKMEATNWAVMKLKGNAKTHIHFLCEMDAFHADLSEAKLLMGIEFRFTPKYTKV